MRKPRRRRDDFWDWRDTVAAIAAGVLTVLAVLAFFSADAQAQENGDVQRQIDRIRTELDRLQIQVEGSQATSNQRALEGFARLAAVEREVELNRMIVFGTAAGFLVNAILAGLTFRRTARIERAVNGSPR